MKDIEKEMEELALHLKKAGVNGLIVVNTIEGQSCALIAGSGKEILIQMVTMMHSNEIFKNLMLSVFETYTTGPQPTAEDIKALKKSSVFKNFNKNDINVN